MNKYSKRALKTTATVGMSLAMVLSGVAAPLTNVKAAFCLIATDEELATMNVFMNKNSKWKEAKAETTFNANYVVKGAMFDVTGMPIKTAATSTKDKKYPATITMGTKTLSLVWGTDISTTEQTGDAKTAYFYATDKTGTVDVEESIKTKVNLIDYINGVLTAEKPDGTAFQDSEVSPTDVAGSLTIITGPAEDFNIALLNVKDGCIDVNSTNAKDLLNLAAAVSTTGDALITLAIDGETGSADQYDNIEAFLTKYDANLTEAQKDVLNAEIERLAASDDLDSSSSNYQTALSNFVDREMDKLEKLISDSDYTSLSTSNAGKVITNATVDGILKTLKDTADYKRFKKEGLVIDLVAEIEALKEDVKTVATAVDRVKNESYKAYVAGGTKSVKNIVSGIKHHDTDVFANNNLKIKDYEILKAFKTDVVDVIFTMESKEVGSRWVNKSSQSAFVTDAKFDAVLADFGILEDFNSEDGTFLWDAVEAHMEKVIASLETLKTLEKLDAVTLQAGDRDKLIAIDDAVYFLQGYNSYSVGDNLTSAESRTLRDASRKITELMETYRVKFGSIDTTVNGWVNKGNGDWTYYENGAAVTKWVAAGTNWFYVKDGNMLRNSWVANNSTGSKWYYVNNEGQMVSNTTVNGYAFDANGVWVK